MNGEAAGAPNSPGTKGQMMYCDVYLSARRSISGHVHASAALSTDGGKLHSDIAGGQRQVQSFGRLAAMNLMVDVMLEDNIVTNIYLDQCATEGGARRRRHVEEQRRTDWGAD
jgi:hypothetical protein